MTKALVTTLLASILVGATLAAPGTAHDSTSITHNWRRHYRPLAKAIFYTKAGSDARFVSVGEQASDAALLDGMDSSAFAFTSHAHSGADITTGTVEEARIAAGLARDSEVVGIVAAADGSGSGLDADQLDGLNSGAFATAAHTHSGGDIASGTVDESVIDVLMARVADVFDIVLAADGSGSGLDADLLDGQSAGAFEVNGLANVVQWFKESADTLPTTTTPERVVFTAPEDVTITDVFVEPAAGLTASDTNFATILLSRRDATGSNEVTLVSATTRTAGSGGTGTWNAFETISLGALSNTSLTEGQKLTIELTKSGLGVVVPVSVVQIEYTVD